MSKLLRSEEVAPLIEHYSKMESYVKAEESEYNRPIIIFHNSKKEKWLVMRSYYGDFVEVELIFEGNVLEKDFWYLDSTGEQPRLMYGNL